MRISLDQGLANLLFGLPRAVWQSVTYVSERALPICPVFTRQTGIVERDTEKIEKESGQVASVLGWKVTIKDVPPTRSRSSTPPSWLTSRLTTLSPNVSDFRTS